MSTWLFLFVSIAFFNASTIESASDWRTPLTLVGVAFLVEWAFRVDGERAAKKRGQR